MSLWNHVLSGWGLKTKNRRITDAPKPVFSQKIYWPQIRGYIFKRQKFFFFVKTYSKLVFTIGIKLPYLKWIFLVQFAQILCTEV